jgi:RNA polymerase sigma-70 factor (ECF subfamily)
MDQTEIINMVNQCRKGDSSSFRLIVEEYQYMIYQLAFRMLCNEDEAKDIVQETFIRAWQNLSKYRSEIRMSTWLYTIATNRCIDLSLIHI